MVDDRRVDNAGVGLAYTVIGPEDGVPVLLLHGLSSSRATWAEAMERLSDRFRVYAVDFRGHGASDHAPGTYVLEHYASDARTMLELIGRPTILVGHSLGGLTGAYLASQAEPGLAAALLEDPPLYLGTGAFEDTVFAKVFPLMRDAVAKLQADEAAVDAYVEMAGSAPSLAGGTVADHMVPWQLKARGAALAQMDPTAWDAAIDGSVFAAFDPEAPLSGPVTVLKADTALGAAFLDGDDERLRSTSPQAEIIAYEGIGHGIHSETKSCQRFLDDLDRFVTANAS